MKKSATKRSATTASQCWDGPFDKANTQKDFVRPLWGVYHLGESTQMPVFQVNGGQISKELADNLMTAVIVTCV